MRSKRNLLTLLVALVVSVLVAVIPSERPARADHIRLTLTPVGEPVAFDYYTNCTASAVVEVREIVDSDISRFAVEFQRRGANDPYLPGLAYDYVGWWISSDIPLDSKTYWWRVILPPRYMNFPSGGSYALWAKAVGERDSFWQPDLVETLKLGEIGCDGEATDDSKVPRSWETLKEQIPGYVDHAQLVG